MAWSISVGTLFENRSILFQMWSLLGYWYILHAQTKDKATVTFGKYKAHFRNWLPGFFQFASSILLCIALCKCDNYSSFHKNKFFYAFVMYFFELVVKGVLIGNYSLIHSSLMEYTTSLAAKYTSSSDFDEWRNRGMYVIFLRRLLDELFHFFLKCLYS